MKILSLSTSDLNGGAPRAAYRLHRGLLAANIDSQMLVQNKLGADATVLGGNGKLLKGLAVAKPTLDTLPLLLYRQRDRTPYVYSCQWLPSKINERIEVLNPDLINLHWVCGGFFPVEAIAKFNRPLVWTLHDMWGFTGGCHYSGECDRYQQSCGRCPILKSDRDWDWSRWLWQKKTKAWQQIDLTIVTPSKWLADCAKASSLFRNRRIEVIPNGIDPRKYRPFDRQQARNWLGLPQDKQIILFGALSATSDRRKGFHLLLPALQRLKQYVTSDRIELVVFGSPQPDNPVDFGFKTHYLGKLHDDLSLALVYGAADVFVAPSVQDNLPNTVVEALACGTPCAAFAIGGMPDLIDPQENGYLATAFDLDDLARGIAWILADSQRWQSLSLAAVAKARREFMVEVQTERYCQLYKEILTSRDGSKF